MISLLDAEGAMESPALPDLKDEIHLVRGERVMLDSALAEIYGVPTKQLNQQMRRNRKKFPADFAFQLTPQEFTNLRSQIVTSSYGGRRYLPWVQAIAQLFQAIRSLIAPAAGKKPEIGFHVREEPPRSRRLKEKT